MIDDYCKHDAMRDNMDTFAWTLFVDFATLSVLLLAGQALRAKVGLLQRWRIPACILAGALALLFGPNGMGGLPISDEISVYPGLLVVLIFAAIPLATTAGVIGKMGREVGEMFCHVTFGILAQYGWGLLLGLTVLNTFWELQPGFGFVLGIGFWGGPGTTAAAASAFEGYQWDDALSLGLTAWMIGTITAIVLGTALINREARKRGEESGATGDEDAGRGSLTGLIPVERREPLGMETVSPASMDSLTLHVSLIAAVALAGWYLNKALKLWWGGVNFPIFGLALVCGFLVHWLLRASRAASYVDHRTISRISGCFADYLIVAGMAAIQWPRVVQYAAPLAVLLGFGVLLSLGQLYWLGPRMFRDHWFDKSILIFGMNTGTLAQGILLLRMADPRMQSRGLVTYGIVDLLIKPLSMGMVLVGPILIGTGHATSLAVVCSAFAFVPLIVAWKAGWWVSGGKRGPE